MLISNCQYILKIIKHVTYIIMHGDHRYIDIL